jgi:hypothetical protein
MASEANWKYISKHKKLSEEFMKKNEDKINWYYVSQFQKLSEEFMSKYENKIN